MKDKLIAGLKIVVSLGLMTYLFYRFLSDPVDRQTLVNTLAAANYWYLFLALGLYLIAVVSNAVKWFILLRAQGIPVPLGPVTNYTFVGFFFNNFLPANVGGDIMRGYGLARYTERSAEAAVSVVVDRIIGLLAYMFTAVIAALIAVYLAPHQLTTHQTLTESLKYIGLVAIIGTIAIAAAFAMMLSHRLRQLVGKVFALKFLQPLQPLYQRLSDAFGAYRHQYAALLGAFGVGVINVLLTGLVDVTIIAGLPGHIPPIYIFLFNPIIAVALIAPISIGGLGTMSAFYVYFYGLVGVAGPLAFALSLIKQAVIYLGSLPGGVLWLRRREKAGENNLSVEQSGEGRGVERSFQEGA
ncbi:MAG: flippase-like domain-containing protein [Anaerolineae bacterium]|nr:flippase-like domain-containing protein [Anaerolineae bacterium]